jgi:[CysO sulfur-carrier protein]-S-L-cysteine hydrolase
MRISREHWDELVAHAREEAPNECCGYFWGEDGHVREVHRAINERHSRYGYELDSKSHFELWKRGEAGYQVGSYHSHPRSSAEPSQTDINLAKNWPDYLYIIVSLDGDPTVRAWWLKDGEVKEEPLEVG